MTVTVLWLETEWPYGKYGGYVPLFFLAYFPPLRIIRTGYGAHPASYTMGTEGSLSWGKVARAWSWPLNSN
jgi:hypothetical protein